MDKAFLLEQIKLLAALESWSLSTKERIPDYLIENMDKVADRLSEELLGDSCDEKETGPWINWHGGERPVAPDTRVAILMRDLDCETHSAGSYRWEHNNTTGDIVAYRVAE